MHFDAFVRFTQARVEVGPLFSQFCVQSFCDRSPRLLLCWIHDEPPP